MWRTCAPGSRKSFTCPATGFPSRPPPRSGWASPGGGKASSVAGSSLVFERGFVTYSNEAKEELLGVPRDLIEAHGAVSEQVARAMAEFGDIGRAEVRFQALQTALGLLRQQMAGSYPTVA